MLKKIIFYTWLSLFIFSVIATAQSKKAEKEEKIKKRDFAALVNPFIGTVNNGHTFPGATLPFGMVQLSPDTRLDGPSGYNYSDSVVYGFSHTHLNGTGVADYGDILFMPTTGKPQLKNTQYLSKFTKKNESATAGYYETKLDKYNINVEVTATKRAGFHHYSYPKTDEANIIIDLQHRDEVLDAYIEVVNDSEIKGFRRSKSWAQNQQVFFHAKFNKPFKTFQIAKDDNLITDIKSAQGKNIKMYVQFDNPGDVLVKVGISGVDGEGALKNLDAEIKGFDFKETRKAAKEEWNKELEKINVNGGITAQQVVFYTALYHTMISPNIFNDVDGRYLGMDKKIHTAKGYNHYTVFSLWDTYRTLHPLFNIIDRKRTLDFIKTFLAQYQQSGLLPIWELAANETFTMIGNHAIPVIVDAYAKGIKDFDTELAFKAMKEASDKNKSYLKNGLVLADDEKESVSKTLEYAYNDWCVAQMAKMLNKTDDYKTYIIRSQNWKNVFDKSSGFMRAVNNGSFAKPFDPTEINQNYTEANAWQYSFYLPQDIDTYADYLGGKDSLEAKLDEMFTSTAPMTGKDLMGISGMIGQYAHGNEPSHHIAYLYNFTNNPSKSAYYLQRILNELYRMQPAGLAGNDDCGQMSAWYVMSALGFYPVTPGQNNYILGTTIFTKSYIFLENGKRIDISNPTIPDFSNLPNQSQGAPGANSVPRPQNVNIPRTGPQAEAQRMPINTYLQSITLNGDTYSNLFIDYEQLKNGAKLEMITGKIPNRLFMETLKSPVSKITETLIVANPYFEVADSIFKEKLLVTIKNTDPEVKIYYTTDGTEPSGQSKSYTNPFEITSSGTIKAIAVKNDKKSFVTSATYKKLSVKMNTR